MHVDRMESLTSSFSNLGRSNTDNSPPHLLSPTLTSPLISPHLKSSTSLSSSPPNRDDLTVSILGMETGTNPTGLCYNVKNTCLYVCYRGTDIVRGLSLPDLKETFSVKITKPTGLTFVIRSNEFGEEQEELAVLDEQSQIFIINVSDKKITKLAELDKGFLLFSSGITYCKSRDLYFVADCCTNDIKKIDRKGKVTSFAGNSHRECGHKDGIGKQAYFNNPRGICCDSENERLFVSDTWNNCIREIDRDGCVKTVAGVPGKTGFQDGPSLETLWNWPSGMTYDEKTNSVVITDTYNYRIRKVSLDDDIVSTLAGTGKKGLKDSTPLETEFAHPNGIAIDPENRFLFTASTRNHKIRKINISRSINEDEDAENGVDSRPYGGSGSSSNDYSSISKTDSKEILKENIVALESKIEIYELKTKELRDQLSNYQKKAIELEDTTKMYEKGVGIEKMDMLELLKFMNNLDAVCNIAKNRKEYLLTHGS